MEKKIMDVLTGLMTKSKDLYDMSLSLSELGVPVQKLWLFVLPWKMQTVVNQGLRAPDTHMCPKVKILCRWLRSVTLNNADDDHSFMCRKKSMPTFSDLTNELNYCSMHFATHLLYALEIIGYKHPNQEIRDTAFGYYSNIVEGVYHFNPETEKELDVRLADVKEAEKISTVLKLSKEAEKPPKICPTYDPYVS